MTNLDPKDLGAFQTGPGPQAVISHTNTTSGTLKVDEGTGAVRYRGGRDHDRRRVGDLVVIHRPGKPDRIARITHLEQATELTYDVEAVIPHDKAA